MKTWKLLGTLMMLGLLTLAGCGGGPRQSTEGEGAPMLDPAAVENAATIATPAN